MYTHKSDDTKIIMSKEHMRTKGFKSPDDADSIMMAYHATQFLNRKIEDNEDFRTPINRKQSNNNLFHIAGYR